MENTYLSQTATNFSQDGIQSVAGNIQIEDDRTGMSPDTLKRAFLDNLFYIQGIAQEQAAPYDYYLALAYTVRDRLLHRFIKTVETYKKDKKNSCAICQPSF